MYADARLEQRAMRLPYAAPRVDLGDRDLEDEPAVPIVAVLGLVAFGVVLAWGAWCVSTGGNFYFSYTWPLGIVVTCTRP
ncbi:MAG: hypothetical protein M3T56_04570 [Chloroflexota bacterium]|nr:hypothetical protein [Chloroflexota bacterium]